MFLSFCVLDDFFRFSKKLGFWVFLVHPTAVSVLLSASVERFFVSRMRDFWLSVSLFVWWAETSLGFCSSLAKKSQNLTLPRNLNGQNLMDHSPQNSYIGHHSLKWHNNDIGHISLFQNMHFFFKSCEGAKGSQRW